jgi:hypothetical protein
LDSALDGHAAGGERGDVEVVGLEDTALGRPGGIVGNQVTSVLAVWAPLGAIWTQR